METLNKRKVYTTPLLYIRMVKPCTMLAASGDPTGNVDPWKQNNVNEEKNTFESIW